MASGRCGGVANERGSVGPIDDDRAVATLSRTRHFQREGRSMAWASSTVWWVIAGGLVAVELATGTFYLLMLALGAVDRKSVGERVEILAVAVWLEDIEG